MKSLRMKIICIMTAIVMVVCGVLTICAGYSIFNSTNSTLKKMLEPTAQLAADDVSTNVNVLKKEINTLARTDALSFPEDKRDKQTKLDRLKKEQANSGYLLLAMINPDGSTYLSSTEQPLDVSGSEAFQRALASGDQAFVEAPRVDKAKNQVTVTFASPIIYDGKTTQVLMGVYDYKVIGDVLEGIVVGETGRAYIIDKTGTTIADKKLDNVLKQDNVAANAKSNKDFAKLAQLHDEMLQGKMGVGEYTLAGTARVVGYAPVADTDWFLAVTAPRNEFMVGMGGAIIFCLITSLVMCLFAIVIGAGFATSISKPILAITRRMQLLAHGDVQTPVPLVKAKDETGMLAEALQTVVESLSRVLSEVCGNLSQMADGNFDLPALTVYEGNFETLSVASNRIVESLNSALTQIEMVSGQVSGSSEQMASSAQSLSHGATEQASSVQELSETIIRISTQITLSAQNATEAERAVNAVGDEIEQSNEQMQSMIEAMREISEKSGQIGKIIQTIDSIAFQTNILALNASVEAARAGAAGKGFAVVADEVRNLAGKSADAAKTTTELIEQSIRAVQNGTKIADATAQSLLSVVGNAKGVITTVNQISSATAAQAASVSQVTGGVEQISAVVQTNSAASEESAATAEELAGQATMLRQLVSKFKTKQ